MSIGDWTHHQYHDRPSPDCHLCHSTPATLQVGNVDRAKQRMAFRFETFVNKIQAQEREEFFHPINASTWISEFAYWLKEEQDKYGASND